jgi:hypothetical protein
MNMLDIGALNAFIIWMLKNKDWNQSKPNCRYQLTSVETNKHKIFDANDA